MEGRVTPESGKLEGYILKCGNDRVKFSENRIDGAKPSALKYRVIKYEGNASVLEVELLSGRIPSNQGNAGSLRASVGW